MLTYWLPEGPSLLPANASHQVGVGGFVINEDNEVCFAILFINYLRLERDGIYIIHTMNLVDWKQVLVVQERFCSPTLTGLWKLPTGFILEVYGEMIIKQSI